MKRALLGGFLTTIGSIWTAAAVLHTDIHMDKLLGWRIPPGKFVTAAFEYGGVIPLLLGLIMLFAGAWIMFQEFRRP